VNGWRWKVECVYVCVRIEKERGVVCVECERSCCAILATGFELEGWGGGDR
jgi:hypothetical protein